VPAKRMPPEATVSVLPAAMLTCIVVWSPKRSELMVTSFATGTLAPAVLRLMLAVAAGATRVFASEVTLS